MGETLFAGERGDSSEANANLVRPLPLGFLAMVPVVVALFNALRQLRNHAPANTRSSAPSSTCWPSAKQRRSTMPSLAARIACSIFIASRIIRT